MLSYIDIEAFATATYRPTSKASSALISTETEKTATISSIHVAYKRKQTAKRIITAAKHIKTKQAV